MRLIATSIALVMAAGVAFAADSAPPKDFADVPLGASLHELKARYPDASRNPDSDRHFQVYQVAALHGVDAKSPGAFQIYQGKVVGGQILLDSHNAQQWLDAMKARYGKPDSCTYCYDAEMASASWHWDNGTSLKIDGEMLTELTKEGTAQRSAWLARGNSGDEQADSGDETTDEYGDAGAASSTSTSHRQRHLQGHEGTASSSTTTHQASRSGWRGYYDNLNSRLEHWMGWK